MSSVIFEDQSLLVGVVWKTADNLLYSSTFDVDVADDAPQYGALDLETDMDLLNPFTNWSGERVPREDKLQYSIHFQDSTADIYYEVDSEATLWAHFMCMDGVATDVTFAGAATLTAAAGAILASLIF